jgi:hypothetical protein
MFSRIGPCEMEFLRIDKDLDFSRVCLTNGRKVASDATVIPVPGSIVDQIANLEELSKK